MLRSWPLAISSQPPEPSGHHLHGDTVETVGVEEAGEVPLGIWLTVQHVDRPSVLTHGVAGAVLTLVERLLAVGQVAAVGCDGGAGRAV